MEDTQPFYNQIDCLLKDEDWTWSQKDKISSLLIKGKEAIFHPRIAFGTVSCMMNKPLTPHAVVYWEIRVKRIFGTSIMFGVARENTEQCLTHAFANILGQDSNSYGITHRGEAFHAGISFNFIAPLPEGQPCTIGMLFDGPKRQLSYFVDGIYQGTPFKYMDLTEPLFPIVSSTAQRSQFRIQNQKGIQLPMTLFQTSLNLVHSLCLDECDQLPIPHTIISSLNEMEESRKARLQRIKRASAVRKSTQLDESFVSSIRNFISIHITGEQNQINGGIVNQPSPGSGNVKRQKLTSK